MFSNTELDIIKTQIISLGTCCSYAKYKRQFFIEQNKKNEWGKTHFFDWLLCTYPNNLTILKTNNIEKLLQYNNWRLNANRKTATLCKNIKFEGHYLIRSLHDYPKWSKCNESIGDFNKYIFDKYVRRHKRLIDKLKNQNNLILMYQDNLNDEEWSNFVTTIKNITNKRFIIISWTGWFDDETKWLKRNEYSYIINFRLLTRSPDNRPYHCNNVNKSNFFRLLLDIYNDAFE